MTSIRSGTPGTSNPSIISRTESMMPSKSAVSPALLLCYLVIGFNIHIGLNIGNVWKCTAVKWVEVDADVPRTPLDSSLNAK